MESFNLNVVEARKETRDVRIITFHIPENLRRYLRFKAGQYITITIRDENNIKHTRCYSICDQPSESMLSVGVKKIPNGIVSTYLVDDLKINNTLEVGIPNGRFTVSPLLLRSRHYVFFSGGSGITPIKAMIDSLIRNEPLSKITLIYGNSNEKDIVFKNYFDNIVSKRVRIIYSLTNPQDENWAGDTGKLNKEKCLEILRREKVDSNKIHCYICGPTPMMEQVKLALEEINVPDKRIFQEFFVKALDANQIPQVGGVKKVHVNKGDQVHTLLLDEGETILDAVLKSGIDVAYACKSGICSSCVARLNSGEIISGDCIGLTEEDKQKNLFLSCQTVPKSDVVDVEFRDNIKYLDLRHSTRVVSIAIAAFIATILVMTLLFQKNRSFLSRGELTIGHEELNCSDCHKPAKGTERQQLQANFRKLLNLRDKEVDFGLQNVTSSICLDCHERPDDRHPVHRFLEPKFAESRKEIHPENCESCHLEHQNKRVTINNLTYCQTCHEDTKLESDPLDVSHEELVKQNKWETCLQCHDYHGNHIMEVATVMKDTIPLMEVINYMDNGEDPYSELKQYLVNELESD